MLEDFECCPHCGESFQGPEILQEYIDKGYYGEVVRYYSTKLGIDVRGVYDGILIWKCEKCQHMWPRFSYEQWGTLHERAVNIIHKWNKESSNV